MNQVDLFELEGLKNKIILEKNIRSSSSFMVGVSGIDGSGKGFVSNYLKEELEKLGITVHVENLDGWLNLPEIRFSNQTPAETFYRMGFRLDELIEKVLLPYNDNQYVHTQIKYLEETWDQFEIMDKLIEKVDVFILEGIFIFQKKILPYLSYKIWVDCSFDTALKRAVFRNQERLSNDDIIRAYRYRYFKAQELHIELDKPREKADVIYFND